MSIISVDDLHKIYVMGTEEVHALRGVTFNINEGEYLSVMGPSASMAIALACSAVP